MTKSTGLNVIALFRPMLVIYSHGFPVKAFGVLHLVAKAVESILLMSYHVISCDLILGRFIGDRDISLSVAQRALRLMPILCFLVVTSAFLLGPLASTFAASEQLFGNVKFWPQYEPPGVFGAAPYLGAVNGLWRLLTEVAVYLVGPLMCIAGTVLIAFPLASSGCPRRHIVSCSSKRRRRRPISADRCRGPTSWLC